MTIAAGTRAQQVLLSIAVTITGRVCVLRDRLLRKIPWNGRMETAGPGTSRLSIRSGGRVLDGVLVQPKSAPAVASLLICHGIGETVAHWHGVQQMLATNGIASLVFDYGGYGRSRGWFNAQHAEEDAISAFHRMEQATAPLPVSILGLSLGTGIATAVVGRVAPHRLGLRSAFTSLRSAAGRVGVPTAFSSAVPPIWDAEAALRTCSVPVLIVHGEKDRLFPVHMATELAEFCGANGQLVLVPEGRHNEPFSNPQPSYWGSIVAQFLLQK